MTTEHIFFIPAVFLLGLVLGYRLGTRAIRTEIARRKKRGEEI